jgi:hypothetical protein
MSHDPAREQRERAAERLALAQRISDSTLRASLVAMAQKWLDRAHKEPHSNQTDPSNKTLYYYFLQTNIGRELQDQFDLPQQMPHRMLTLLMQLNERTDRGGA